MCKNLFKEAKSREHRRIYSKCFICGEEFIPDKRNTKRGWGMFCSKSCSAIWKNRKKSLSELRDYRLKQLGL